MKVLLLLTLFYGCRAAVILTPRNPDDLGAAVTFQNQDVLGQYNFGYSEGHPSGASFRRESGDAFGNKVGSFGLRDADGRVRIVRYVADANGFRADVTSNEPGVAPQDPASATINKPLVVPQAVVPVAPVAVPPPPPPPPAPVVAKSFPPPPPPPAYNYVIPAPAVAAPPLPPPPAYYPPPPRVSSPVAIPAPYAAPVAIPAPVPVAAPVAVPGPAPFGVAPKGLAAFAPAPPPPAYYTNLVGGKGYAGAVRSFVPPFASVPPQFGYLKSPPAYQALGYPL